MNLYLIGSLRNPKLPSIGRSIRELGFEVFDDWFGAGERADDAWQEYEEVRGRHYSEALYGDAATNIFRFDMAHLSRADVGVLALPAGKSGHMELGYLIGQRKPTFVLFEGGEPKRWDLMYRMVSEVAFSVPELLDYLDSLWHDRERRDDVAVHRPGGQIGIRGRVGASGATKEYWPPDVCPD